jgi:hypothetical protein
MSYAALLELSTEAIKARDPDPEGDGDIFEIRLKDKFYELYQKKVLDIIFSKDAFEASKGKPGFLGGLAIPLAKEDLSTSLGRVSYEEAVEGYTPDDLWNYQISPKVDGERFLMFLASDSRTVGTKKDTLLDIYFIDRYNKPYILQKDADLKRIPTMRKLGIERRTEAAWQGQNMIPPCLIDGELLAVVGTGRNRKLVNPRLVDAEDIKEFYFVAFDILLGPSKPKEEKEHGLESVWVYGDNAAMCGPKVGGLHGRDWSFISRSNVLRKILDPQGPYIQTYTEACPWFKTLYKPHYSVNKLNEVVEVTSKIRRDIGLPNGVEFDGIIFTPKWGKYMISHGESRGQVAWIAPNNTVYKWKPIPTVDLLVGESGILYCGSGRKRKPINFPSPGDNVGIGNIDINGGIGEFTFNNGNWYLIKDRSLERDKPNGCETFEKTVDTIENPIRVEDFEVGIRYYDNTVSLREFLNTVMSKEDLIKMVICGGRMSLSYALEHFDKAHRKLLQDVITKMERGIDAVRLAPGSKLRPKITADMYHLLLKKMRWGGFPTAFPPEYLRMSELLAQPPPPPRNILMKRKTKGSKTTTFWFDRDVNGTDILLHTRTVEWNRKYGEMEVDLDNLYRVNMVSRKPVYLNFVIRSGNVVDTTSELTRGGNIDVETKIRFVLNNDWYLDMAEVKPLNNLEKDPDFRLTLVPIVQSPGLETLSQAVGMIFSILSLK